MKSAARQSQFILREYARLFTGLDDRHLAMEPTPGVKTAGWLVGHMAVTGDFGRRLCGLPPLAPKEWRVLFSPGTQPNLDASVYPPMATLVETFRAVYADFTSNGANSTAASLDEPNPYEPARPAFPTSRDFAKYLLTGHLAFHLGQLSNWRAAAAAKDPALKA